ncbi:MAG: hypothetical protein HYV39_00425 [Candidatus Levybacteria bacterium]|nr:hypothetical protein [Candidatus Levybacteria bacterium]
MIPKTSPQLIKRGEIRDYQGFSEKIDALLEQQPQDRSNPSEVIPFKLRQGSQSEKVFGRETECYRLAFKADTQGKISLPEDVHTFGEDAWVLQKQDDGTLRIQFSNIPTEEVYLVSREQLANATVVLPLTDSLSLGVTGYDPDNNLIRVYKISSAAPPAVVPTQLASQSEPLSPPAPIEEKIFDESLKCLGTEKRVAQPGDSFFGLLIKVNGLGRYLDEDAKLDVSKLYPDLMCLLAHDDNELIIGKSDPKAIAVVRSLKENARLIGPVTSDMLYQALIKLNNPPRFPGADKQLVTSHPEAGVTVTVPKFT